MTAGIRRCRIGGLDDGDLLRVPVARPPVPGEKSERSQGESPLSGGMRAALIASDRCGLVKFQPDGALISQYADRGRRPCPGERISPGHAIPTR